MEKFSEETRRKGLKILRDETKPALERLAEVAVMMLREALEEDEKNAKKK